MGRTKLTPRRDRSGFSDELLDRRLKVWEYRAQGLSYSAIGKRLGIGKKTAHEDGLWCAQEWGKLEENSREAIKGQLVEVMRRATHLLLVDAENQAVNGQVTEALAADGTVIGVQRKGWINAQTVAELGRTTERIAKMAGVLESGIDGAAVGSVSNVQVVLPAAMDGIAFADAAAKGALTSGEAVNTAPVDISAEPVEGHSSGPESSETLP
ncbi:MAG: hypothetical protein CMP86_15390 [Gammaproteobacteria bacterium]|nr:hypothetical protein [Gammaproteobacteria bacterium]